MDKHNCQFCKRQFTLRSNCVRHEKIHTNDKPHKCKICLTRFILKKNMVDHMRVHTGEKPFQCEFCEKKFNRHSSVVRHSRIHTNEKPFECHHCGKKFAWKFYLVRHMRNSHMAKERRQFAKQKKNDTPQVLQLNCEEIIHAVGQIKRTIEYKMPTQVTKNMVKFEENQYQENKMAPDKIIVKVPRNNSSKPPNMDRVKCTVMMSKKQMETFSGRRLVVKVTKCIPETSLME